VIGDAIQTVGKGYARRRPRLGARDDGIDQAITRGCLRLGQRDAGAQPQAQLRQFGAEFVAGRHLEASLGNALRIDKRPFHFVVLQVRTGGPQALTAVIGGLIRTDESSVRRGVPIVKDIPLVGMFFRSSNNTRTNRELIIFVTPRLLAEMASK